jgi:hypothetical protein
MTCAIATDTAGPKCCARSTIERLSETSSVGSAACTAVIGVLKPIPLAKLNEPGYRISRTKLVSTPKVVIRPAKMGVSREEKIMNGV